MEVKLETGSMNDVVIEREKLLEIVKENKAKHDIIYSAAVQGYWKKLGRELSKKWTILGNLVKETEGKMEAFQADGKFKLDWKENNWSYGFKTDFPQNHENDYNRVIKMLELSIHEKFTLTFEQFNTYVMNNWNWKSSFLTSNVGYTQGYSGYSGLSGYSGFSGTGVSGYISNDDFKKILESF